MIGLIQIPSTGEAVDDKGVYTVFNIHVNGCYHGSFRYSQLLSFHQEVKAQFNVSGLEEFPGKHWFSSLSPDQLFARRIGLERYLHSLCQDRAIGTSDTLKEFLIAIQKASTDVTEPTAEVEVFLVNGKSVSVQVGSFDRTDQVLEKVATEIQLAPGLTYYFGLFLEKETEDTDTWTVDRSLNDFECPYLTLHAIHKTAPHRITIRKNFWDPVFIKDLLEDRVAKNLLYIEALSCVTQGHWDIDAEAKKKLSALQRKGHKKEYLELAGTLSQFGFIQLEGLTLDHPTEDITGPVRVGKLEIVSYSSAGGEEEEEPAERIFTYSLIKIRSWKLGGKPGSPWLKFFFQVGAGDFVPVSVVGSQTVLMSYSLHAIVDELLRVRAKEGIRQPQTTLRTHRDLPKVVFYEAPVPLPSSTDDASHEEDTADTKTASTEPTSEATPTPPSDHTQHEPQPASNEREEAKREAVKREAKREEAKREAAKKEAAKKGDPKRLTSVSSVEEPSESSKAKVKTPKKKLLLSVSDVENPTFQFGTDDDL